MLHRLAAIAFLALAACGGPQGEGEEASAADAYPEDASVEGEFSQDADLANEAAAAEAADAAAGGNMAEEDVSAADNAAASNR